MRTRVLVLVVLAACGSPDKKHGKLGLTVDPGSITSHAGGGGYVTVTVSRKDGFKGEVTVSLADAPDGVAGADLVLAADQDSGLIDVHTDVEGSTTVTLMATGAGVEATTDLALEVLPAAPSSQALIEAALLDEVIDYPTSLLYRAYALYDDDRLPEAYRGPADVEVEDSGFPSEAASPDLPADVQAALAPFLVRPVDPASIFQVRATSALWADAPLDDCVATDESQTIESGWKTARATGPIRIWVQCTGDDVDDIILQSAVGLASKMFGPMTGLMGPPVLDGEPVGMPGNLDENAIDIYIPPDGGTIIRPLSAKQEFNGLTFPAVPVNGNASSGYIIIGRTRAMSSGFYSTLTHEFFHVLQMAHNRTFMFEPVANSRKSIEYWWVEASATWASSFFARSLAPGEVYKRFTGTFQKSTKSLHRSYSGSETDTSEAYAAFIWGFYEEQATNGPTIIATSWDALRDVTGHDQANQVLDGVFDFTTNFRKFAVRNINKDLPGVLPVAKRYKGLDKYFPDNKEPTYIDDRTLSSPGSSNVDVNVAPLRAAYYKYKVEGTTVKKVIVHFDEIYERDGLDIDGVVKIAGKDWKVEDYSGKDKQTFCLTQDDQKLEQLILVLSNHNLPFTDFALGSMKIETSELPCKLAWTGTLRHEVHEEVPGVTSTELSTAEVTLTQDDSGPEGIPLLTFRPSGTWTFNRTGTYGECNLLISTINGTLEEDPFEGVMLLFTDQSPAELEASVGTGDFDAEQQIICPNPDESFSTDMSLNENLLYVLRDDGFTVSEDGIHLSGDHFDVNSPGYSSEYQWDLTLEE